jgi:hypothetical protein
MQPLLKLLLRLGAAFAALLAFDSLLFRTGWYYERLEPDTSTASYERLFRAERARQHEAGPRILIVGDSRMGFMSRVANEHSQGKGYRFGNVALGGASPRCWYFMIRDLDPDARAYDAVVIPLNDYDDEEIEEDLNNRTYDLNYIIGHVRWQDTFDLARSFPSWDSRWYVLRACVLKGFILKKDFQIFLSSPKKRMLRVRAVRDWPEWVYNFTGEARSLEGMRVDWKAKTIWFPPGVPASSQQATRDVLLRGPIAPTGVQARYRAQWLGRIVDHYSGSKTRVIFFRLPRGPVLRPAEYRLPAGSVVRRFAEQPEVVLVDESAFNSLEEPKYFIDAMHLNGEGMNRLSRMLAELVWRIVPRADGKI